MFSIVLEDISSVVLSNISGKTVCIVLISIDIVLVRSGSFVVLITSKGKSENAPSTALVVNTFSVVESEPVLVVPSYDISLGELTMTLSKLTANLLNKSYISPFVKLSSGVYVVVSDSAKGLVMAFATVVVAMFISVVGDSGVTVTTFVVVGAEVVLIDIGVTTVVSSFSVVPIFIVVGLVVGWIDPVVVWAIVGLGTIVVGAIVVRLGPIVVGAKVVG